MAISDPSGSVEKRTAQQIRVVGRLLTEYHAASGEPLARFLTGFFKRNKQMGSKDRRMATRLAYHYFRIGKAVPMASRDLRLAYGELLCSTESGVVQYVLPDLYPYIQETIPQKIALLEERTDFRLADVFPYIAHLSAGIDQVALLTSLFIQPDLFIRIQRVYREEVIDVLAKQAVVYRMLGDLTAVLPNGTPMDQFVDIAGKFEVQDWSSQQTARYFQAAANEKWWDACAGSGGKSLLLLDNHPGVHLLVSDHRRSILRNLDERFGRAGIRSYRQKIIDLTKETGDILGGEQFDGILLDAPCTGSGTWGRTPEMISAFDRQSITDFAALQKQMASNALKHLKPGKPLIYITCSVFAEENEQVVSYLQEKHQLILQCSEILHGYRKRADTMFVARLIKT